MKAEYESIVPLLAPLEQSFRRSEVLIPKTFPGYTERGQYCVWHILSGPRKKVGPMSWLSWIPYLLPPAWAILKALMRNLRRSGGKAKAEAAPTRYTTESKTVEPGFLGDCGYFPIQRILM